MNVTTEIRNSVYAKLLAKSLSLAIRTEAEHERATEMLLELDERADLSPTEEALAEVITLLTATQNESHTSTALCPKTPELRTARLFGLGAPGIAANENPHPPETIAAIKQTFRH